MNIQQLHDLITTKYAKQAAEMQDSAAFAYVIEMVKALKKQGADLTQYELVIASESFPRTMEGPDGTTLVAHCRIYLLPKADTQNDQQHPNGEREDMSDLDEKLEEVLLPYDLSKEGLPELGDLRTSSEKLIEAIKQAFIDDGWIPEHAAKRSIRVERVYQAYAGNLMTGQEWYERFVSAMRENPGEVLRREDEKIVFRSESAVLKAAKKAAGIDNND